jgi:hypothetical protein
MNIFVVYNIFNHHEYFCYMQSLPSVTSWYCEAYRLPEVECVK